MRPLSSDRWQPPHFDLTRALSIGMPAAASALGTAMRVCAPAGIAKTMTAIVVAQPFRAAHVAGLKACATALTFIQDPLCHEERQSADDARQRHRRTVAAIRIE